MGVMRNALLVVVSAATVVMTGAGPGAGASRVSGAVEPEADLSHHGHVSLWGGELTLRIQTGNHGPSGLTDATVRLHFSAPLMHDLSLPSACLWGGERVVLCRTGHLRALGRGPEITVDLRTVGRPDEVVVRIDTAWSGGASDRNPENHQHRVLVPDTGDRYVF
ncbi:hypothetical protein ACFRR7_04250 [Streptomyces sp. NPDC056909]|uniref:hypothetical protein n=1 Tax=unclassified Streptomyces TaxID=2593676 RepID=UPI00342CBC31|nr:hypothetical protein OG214_16665 [Streptomyces sp. NBC_00872]